MSDEALRDQNPASSEALRDEIAFIRRAIEEGRGYAVNWGGDMLVWGVVIAAGYLGCFASVRGWWAIDSNWIWAGCVALEWLYSLQRVLRHVLSGSLWPTRRPMAHAMRMLWFACGIFLTTLAIAVSLAGEMNQGWYDAVAAGVLGIGFFASSYLSNLGWMRLVAVGWWVGELAVYALRHRIEILPFSAVLMLLLLALPGFVLLRSRPAKAA